MKILVGMPSPDSWGGPISSEPPFVEALRKQGLSVREEVFVYGDKDQPTPILERIRRVFSTALRFRRILKNDTFDLIHFNTAFDLKTILRDSFTLFFLNSNTTKIFFKLHGSEADRFINTNFAVRFLINYLMKRVDGFGVHTSEERANFIRIGFAEEKFYYVKNAVTIHGNLDRKFSRFQKETDEVFDLLFVSRFIPAKGLIETIRSCAMIRDKGFRFVLHCVGDGEMRNEAEEEVTKLGLDDFVKFTGYIPESDVSKYFFSSDLFIFPTRHAEGFPNVLFKAVAVGMPIITTKIRASADYLANSENTLFCTQDPENIADKIIKLIEDKKLRERMSDNNIEFGKSLLPEAIANEFIEIYESVLKS